MDIGETLRGLRKRKGLSQKKLAELTNISPTYISQIENGKRNPTIEIFEVIGKVLNVPFPIISFWSLDIDSIPKEKRKDYLRIEPALKAMLSEVFFQESK